MHAYQGQQYMNTIAKQVITGFGQQAWVAHLDTYAMMALAEQHKMDNQKTLFLTVGVLVLGLLVGGTFSGQAVRKIIGGGGSGCTDRDGDGYYKNTGCGTSLDCNDANPSIHPNAVEVCSDGIDQNCNYIDEACTTTTIQPSGCYENDGGQNLFIKGNTSYYNPTAGRWFSFVDYCVANNQTGSFIWEYYCSANNYADSLYAKCPSSYTCNNGACILV
jgi:hypothetical protein